MTGPVLRNKFTLNEIRLLRPFEFFRQQQGGA